VLRATCITQRTVQCAFVLHNLIYSVLDAFFFRDIEIHRPKSFQILSTQSRKLLARRTNIKGVDSRSAVSEARGRDGQAATFRVWLVGINGGREQVLNSHPNKIKSSA
jgi:hypothetical protein